MGKSIDLEMNFSVAARIVVRLNWNTKTKCANRRAASSVVSQDFGACGAV